MINRLLNIYISFFKTNIESICKMLHVPQTLLNFFVKKYIPQSLFNFFFKSYLEGSPSGRIDLLIPPQSMSKHWKAELEGFKETGDEFLEYFKSLGRLKPTENVLEVGCGVGRMAVALTNYLKSGSYEGFDIIESGIKWCRNNITRQFPNFHFRKADIYNKIYNPTGKYKGSQYIFSYKEGSFDFVILTSVFTHMLPKEVENYFAEIARVLKRDGRCLITFFLLNPESISLINSKASNLDFKYEYTGFRVVDKNVPEIAIAYQEKSIRRLYAKYGLSILEPIHYGNWCKREKSLNYQDIIIAVKP